MSSNSGYEISLKDAVQFIVDNRGKTAPTVDFGITLIATNCVSNQDLYPKKLNVRYVSQETYDTWFRSHPQPGDILLTNKGSQNGAVCLVPDPVDFCIAQDMVALRADPKKIDPLYLFAALRSDLLQKRIKALNVDAVIPHLKKTDFDKLYIPLPLRETQCRIGECYFALSRRIELLREANATLETIAQALFKSWFVDFDPVRAKAEGRQPEGIDAATAALFPDSFEESELGLVPRGWARLPLKEVCSFQKGCSYKGDGLSESQGAYMFNLGCFNEPRVFAFQKVKRYIGEFKPKHQVSAGDLILANTDMTQHRDILGRPLIVPDGMSPGFISHHAFKVCLDERYGEKLKHYLFYSFQQATFRERAVGYATGTTVLALPRDALEKHCVVLPPEALLTAFAEVCQPLLKAVHGNEERASALAELRDTLLPRLISGQLRLPEAEALVEEVV